MLNFIKSLFENKKKKALEDCTPYNSPCGVDVRVYFNDELQPLVQGISFGIGEDGQPGGTAIFVLFDRIEHTRWLGKEATIGVVAHNGTEMTLYHAKVRFNDYEEFGIAVDDIVMEVRLDFAIVERYFDKYVRPENRR